MQIYGRVEMEYILNFVIIAIEILCLKNFIEIFAEKNKKTICMCAIYNNIDIGNIWNRLRIK